MRRLMTGPPPPKDRRSIAIEDVLRSDTSLADLARTLADMRLELPGRGAGIALLAALVVGEVGLQVGLALTGKVLLGGVLDGVGMDWRLGALAPLLLVAILVVTWQRQAWQETLALRWRAGAVARLSRHIADGSLEDLAAVPMAELREIVMTDAPYLTRFGVETLSQGLVLALWSLASVGFLALYGAPLLGVLVVVVGLCVAIFAGGAKKHLGMTSERFRRVAALSQAARDVVEVERVLLVRQFGLGDRFVDGFGRAHAALHDVALAQGRLSAAIRAGMSVLNAVAFLGLVIVGGGFIASGAVEPGVLLAALFVVGQLLAAVIAMGDLAGRAAEAATAGRRLGVYWDADDGPAAVADGPADGTGRGTVGGRVGTAFEPDVPVPPTRVPALVARDVSFGYDARRRVFEHVDVTLERGELAALTAETGAGKSTFARVLCGLLPAQTGSVAVRVSPPEGTAGTAREVPVGALPAGSVLYLGAHPIILPGSLADNLLLGDAPAGNPADLDVVREALARDGVPLDWDLPAIDASGGGLSSGQGQLVQLARAIARDPAVVVFDEATSSLDMATEGRVQAGLLDWCRRRTCLVISHRACPWLGQASRELRW